MELGIPLHATVGAEGAGVGLAAAAVGLLASNGSGGKGEEARARKGSLVVGMWPGVAAHGAAWGDRGLTARNAEQETL